MKHIEVTVLPIAALNPAEYNPRFISDTEKAKLKRSITEFGMVEPIVVNSDKTIIGGHQRVTCARELGWNDVPCVVVTLPKEKEKLLNLALNRIVGEWDYNKLYDILVSLEGDDMTVAGFDTDEIKKIRDLLDSATEDIDLTDDFDDKIGQIELRVFIPPDHPDLEKIRYAVKRVKDDYPEVVIKEML
jgi:site-specific DNA-methyltransferase (adenine-specific)